MNWPRLIDSLLFGLIVGTVAVILDKKGFEARKDV